MKFEKVFLGLIGLVFVGLGAFNLFFPIKGIEGYEIHITEVSSLNEIRANYGGMHLLLGMFFAFGGFNARFRESALLIAALFTGGLVLGRVVSLMLDGNPNQMVWLFLFLEGLGCVVASILFNRSSTRNPDA